MANYSIKDLEKLSGIKAHTIRIWEKRYGLVEPERTDTNIRTYCDSDLKRLLNVSMLNRHGYKISKIACLSDDELSEKIIHLTQDVRDTQSQIENLTIAMIELDEQKFEKSLSRSIIQLGFEETITRIIYPYFVKIGLMWQTGTIYPAQEHFVSNLIRQKLLVAIDSQLNTLRTNAKTFVLYLPEGELHELALLFYMYMIRKRGHKVIYLGQSVPYNDLFSIDDMQPTDYMITSFFSFSQPDIEEYIHKVSKGFPTKKIFITGGQSKDINPDKLPENIQLFASPDKFQPFLNSLP
ncbi:MAG: MerR family transcriptional regulator [Bacteroidetes bacterium]|jgi:DNA-binding transcriptional MerR regulator|nr:MerR family transcriptional regulator [Bacteroidota bacterium]